MTEPNISVSIRLAARRVNSTHILVAVSTRIQVTLDELRKLRAAATVDARHSDRHIALSVWRFDDDMLVCTHLEDQTGHDPPTLHLRRRQDGGLFDRYAAHVEHLWKSGREVELPS
ncbi:hypothetical protein [Plantactinospora sp. CA-290183]|uniref:hypothetical protein n=1 Tax=Plantactinospora sp. CA-290183 TaxID=3240006 RepID=UPI003D919F71